MTLKKKIKVALEGGGLMHNGNLYVIQLQQIGGANKKPPELTAQGRLTVLEEGEVVTIVPIATFEEFTELYSKTTGPTIRRIGSNTVLTRGEVFTLDGLLVLWRSGKFYAC